MSLGLVACGDDAGTESPVSVGSDGTSAAVPGGTADAALANSLVPAGATLRFTVADVLDAGTGDVVASMPIPDGWATGDVSGFTYAAPPADPAVGAVTGLLIDNNCYGQCSPKDWDAELRAADELIAKRLAQGATEEPVAGSEGVVLTWALDGVTKVQVLRWADDQTRLFSCTAVVADADVALLEALRAACISARPVQIAVS